MPEFIFPQPTGQYAVGTKLFELTDPTRNEQETGKPRELVVQVWYPAEGRLGVAMAPYAYEVREVHKRAFAQQGVDAGKIRLLDGIRTHAIPDAPVRREHAPYPVVIFGHGNSAPRGLYSFFCEEIASQGYIVAMVMHTYSTFLIRFADGREVGRTREGKVCTLFDECFADIELMLNQAEVGTFGVLTSACDFGHIGMIGHSLGGIMTAQVCRRDARIKAGINLDGTLWGIDGTNPFHKPFMFMQSHNFYEDMSGVLEMQKDLLEAMGVTKDNFKGSIERFCRENGKDTIRITVHGATHMTFSDDPILQAFFAKFLWQSTEVSGLKATQPLSLPEPLDVIRKCIITFLNRYLKGKSAAYPSVVKHDPGQEDFDFYIPDEHPKHKKIDINPMLLDAYVGSYKLGDVVFVIAKDNGKLYAQILGQEAYQIYPESETTFFYTAADVQISFVKDDKGKVRHLILRQGGRDQVIEKIEE